MSPVEQELFTRPLMSSLPVFVGFVLSFCRVFLGSALWNIVLLFFPFWPLYCLSFLDLRLLITPLVTHIYKQHKGNLECRMFLQTSDPKGQYLIYDIRAAELKKWITGNTLFPIQTNLHKQFIKLYYLIVQKNLWIKTKLSDSVNTLYHLQYK